MKERKIGFVLTETFIQWVSSVKNSPFSQEVMGSAEQLIATFKSRYPEYAELVSQTIQGQKEAFRELVGNTPSSDSSADHNQ